MPRDASTERTWAAKGRKGGTVVPRRSEDSHTPLAHRRGERVGHAAFVVLPRRLAVRQINQVAAVGFGGDQCPHEPCVKGAVPPVGTRATQK